MRKNKHGDPLMLQLSTCNHLRKKVIDRRLTTAGLQDITAPYALMVLEHTQQPDCCQKDLAQQLRISPAAMTATLKHLTREGYVTRITDPEDTRRKLVSITKKGRVAVEQCAASFDSVDALMWNGFSESERAALGDYLARMIANLESAL